MRDAAPPDKHAIGQAVIAACLRMSDRGLNQGTSGNISVRDGDGMLITPSAVPYEQMTPDMLVPVPLEGEAAPSGGLKPSSEWRFHQRLMASRPDIGAVVHAHPAHCTALAVQNRAIPACHYMVAAFGGTDVPLVPYSLFGGEDLAADVARVMRDRHGCLMANHGALTVGRALDEALWRMEELETLARVFLFSHVGGAPVLLSDAQMDDVIKRFASYGPTAQP